MSDLISREALLREMRQHGNMVPTVENVEKYEMDYSPGVQLCIHDAEHAPAIDAVPVVRCADCEFYGPNPFNNPHIGWCRILGEPQKPNFYCANGREK